MASEREVEVAAAAIAEILAREFDVVAECGDGLELCRDIATAALEAVEAARWRPIAEATYDGAELILYHPASKYGREVFAGGVSVGRIDDCLISPTRWQPLPTPPGDDDG